MYSARINRARLQRIEKPPAACGSDSRTIWPIQGRSNGACSDAANAKSSAICRCFVNFSAPHSAGRAKVAMTNMAPGFGQSSGGEMADVSNAKENVKRVFYVRF